MCVCVWERESEKESEKEREKENSHAVLFLLFTLMSIKANICNQIADSSWAASCIIMPARARVSSRLRPASFASSWLGELEA